MNELDIPHFGRFKYPQPYTGSYKDMKFRIVHPKPQEGEENLIYTEVYSGPFCYEKTDKDTMIKKNFEYSMEGYEEMLSYLWDLAVEKFGCVRHADENGAQEPIS